MKISEIIKKSVAEAPEYKWPTYDGAELDRSKYVTASEVGKCLRQIWFGKYAAKYGIPAGKEKAGWGFWQRGHNVEAWVVEQLRRSNDADFEYIGEDQVSFYNEVQSGTPDGLMIAENGIVLFDIKSMDPRKSRKNLPEEKHIKQVMQNIDLVEECLEITITGGKLVYVNCSDYEDILEFDLARNEDMMDELHGRACQVMAAEAAEQLPPEGIYDAGCQYCTFTEHCNAAQERSKKLKAQAQQQEKVAKNVFGKS